MKSIIVSAIVVIATFQFHSAMSSESHHFGERDPFAETCYQETVVALRGAQISKRAINACNKALHRGPHTNEHKSTIYHNRAIIEQAMGQRHKARESLEMAVALTTTTGVQHLALAKLAYEQGDINRALEIYEQLLGPGLTTSEITSQRELLARNRNALLQILEVREGPSSIAKVNRQIDRIGR